MNLSWPLITILNIFFWPLVQLSISYLVLKIPQDFLSRTLMLLKIFQWEENGHIYYLLKVPQFKRYLPDGQKFFSHAFAKKNCNHENQNIYKNLS